MRAELAHNAQELHGVPGVRKAVADTGASSWCTSDEESILPGTYQKFDRPIKLGGIAGELDVIGKGVKRVEMVSTRGKILTKEFEVHVVPGLHVDLVPPQVVVKNAREGWFKVNGERAALEFADCEKKQCFHASVCWLPKGTCDWTQHKL